MGIATISVTCSNKMRKKEDGYRRTALDHFDYGTCLDHTSSGEEGNGSIVMHTLHYT